VDQRIAFVFTESWWSPNSQPFSPENFIFGARAGSRLTLANTSDKDVEAVTTKL